MPSYILKLNDHYLEWSTIVDAPVTFGMTLEEFQDYYRQRYGEHDFERLSERLKRVEEKGTSSINDKNVDDTISFNRAGPKESCLSREEIVEWYCRRKEEPK